MVSPSSRYFFKTMPLIGELMTHWFTLNLA